MLASALLTYLRIVLVLLTTHQALGMLGRPGVPAGVEWSAAAFKASTWCALTLAVLLWALALRQLGAAVAGPWRRRLLVGVAGIGLWWVLLSGLVVVPTKYGSSIAAVALPALVGCVIAAPAMWCLERIEVVLRRLERRSHVAAEVAVTAAVGLATVLWVLATTQFPRGYYSSHALTALALVAGALWLARAIARPMPRPGRVAAVAGVLAGAMALYGFSHKPDVLTMHLLQADLLVRATLQKSWTLFDADGDGFGRPTALLPGLDCDDHDPTIHPRAAEIPANDVDENCYNGPLAARHPALLPPAPEAPPPARPGSPPNLLWITIDAWRYATGAPAGVNPRVAPSLAALAATSQRYDDMRTCSSYTVISVPMTHYGRPRVHPGDPDLSQWLRAAGYHSVLTSTVWQIPPGPAYDEKHHPRDDAQVAQLVTAQVANLPEPYYLYTHFMPLHFPAGLSSYPVVGDCTPADDRWARYDCLLHQIDGWVDAILQGLARSGRAERTVVVVTGDHGEELGEHGGQGHADTLCEHVRHVPLLVRVPGREAAPHPTAINCFDVLATVVDAVGLPRVPGSLGVSHLEVLDTPSIQWATLDYPAERWGRQVSLRAVNIDHWKLLLDTNTGQEAFFDLGADPEELTPVLSPPPRVACRLRHAMDAWLAEVGDLPGEPLIPWSSTAAPEP